MDLGILAGSGYSMFDLAQQAEIDFGSDSQISLANEKFMTIFEEMHAIFWQEDVNQINLAHATKMAKQKYIRNYGCV